MDKLSKAKKKEIINTFAILDVSGSGLITATELSAMMRVFGYDNSVEDVQRMIDAVDTDGSGMMSCASFCAALFWDQESLNQNMLDDCNQFDDELDENDFDKDSYGA